MEISWTGLNTGGYGKVDCKVPAPPLLHLKLPEKNAKPGRTTIPLGYTFCWQWQGKGATITGEVRKDDEYQPDIVLECSSPSDKERSCTASGSSPHEAVTTLFSAMRGKGWEVSPGTKVNAWAVFGLAQNSEPLRHINLAPAMVSLMLVTSALLFLFFGAPSAVPAPAVSPQLLIFADTPSQEAAEEADEAAEEQEAASRAVLGLASDPLQHVDEATNVVSPMLVPALIFLFIGVSSAVPAPAVSPQILIFAGTPQEASRLDQSKGLVVNVSDNECDEAAEEQEAASREVRGLASEPLQHADEGSPIAPAYYMWIQPLWC